MNMVKKKKQIKIGSWKRYYAKKSSNVVVKRVIIGVIVTAIVVVVISLISSVLYNPERLVKNRIEEMARDYYENYVYGGLVNGAMSQDEIEQKMARYEGWGVASVNLRQLLSYNEQKDSEAVRYIKKYCDENKTSVKYYPEAPYGKKSYEVDYEYECEW